MPRKIAIACDGSYCSRYALLWYLQYVSRPDDEVLLLHCIHPYQVLGYAPDQDTQAMVEKMDKYLQDESNAILKEQAAVLAEKNIKSESQSIKGYPKELIADSALAWGAESLVIGSRGLNNVQRLFVGSVADATVHDAKIPVMVVRPPAVQAS